MESMERYSKKSWDKEFDGSIFVVVAGGRCGKVVWGLWVKNVVLVVFTEYFRMKNCEAPGLWH